jgi:hypothetical protein
MHEHALDGGGIEEVCVVAENHVEVLLGLM